MKQVRTQSSGQEGHNNKHLFGHINCICPYLFTQCFKTALSHCTLTGYNVGLHLLYLPQKLFALCFMYSQGLKYWHPWNISRKCTISLRKVLQLQMFWYTHARVPPGILGTMKINLIGPLYIVYETMHFDNIFDYYFPYL